MNPDFIELAKQSPKRIVLPESSDNRILEAAAIADQQGIAEIILLGDPVTITKQLASIQKDLGNIKIVDPDSAESANQYAETLFKLREKKGMTHDQANEISKQPLYFADLMVQTGDADACVAGVINSTGNVIRAALQVLGTTTPGTRLSSFFIMILEQPLNSPVIFADCAINIDPDAEILADIALQSAANANKLLGLDPKIAMLSFSTNGSAKHEAVEKVRNATELVNKQAPDLNVIGDIQLDAAMSKRVLATKWPDSNFQAPANVFVFPSLEAGNIGYKIAERFGNAVAVGPILQGLAKPVNDLSRGADVEAILNTIAVTCLQCN